MLFLSRMRRIGLGIHIFSRFETLAVLALRRSRDEGKHLLASQKYIAKPRSTSACSAAFLGDLRDLRLCF